MVKFWVGFALLVAVAASLGHCESTVSGSSFHPGFSFGSGSGERGSGVGTTETRQVGEFSRIHAAGSGTLDVVVKPGSLAGAVEITTDDNLLTQISTEVRDGVLEISPLVSISPRSGIKLRMTIPALEAVHLEGANKMNLAIDSGKPFELHIEGAGRADVSGKVPQFTVHSEGAGTIDATELVAQTVEVHIEGAGRAKVNATETLKAHIEGAGVITYKGEPARVERDIEGIGRISKAE